MRCESHTFEDMKEAVLTVRVGRSTRTQLEAVARREGRSLSQQVERFITAGLAAHLTGAAHPASRGNAQALAGVLAGAGVPTLADFTAVRSVLSQSLRARTGTRASRVPPRGHGRR